ncbi:phage tail protein [Actinophytocola glycyrrhizae]|uniref:Phage tail protein n=1 Tax=Actinophytocola glycyrrhizae TaxID=2044873 RepID=A0ABV9S8H7_9PSEU
MRGAVPEIANPFPITAFLPAVLQEDPLLARLTEGLDDVLSPAIAVLDCLDAYLDPALTPPDFLGWLGGWVGLDLPADLPVAHRRAAVAAAARLHRRRGTVSGLRDLLAALTGVEVTVADSGGVAWSTTPTDDQAAEPWLRVRAPGADPALVTAIVDAAKPAHVPHTVET